MDIKGDANCTFCKGQGWYYVADGPDDCLKEICECVEFDPENNKMSAEGGYPDPEVKGAP